MAETQGFLMRKVNESILQKNKLLTKAIELETQVSKLENNIQKCDNTPQTQGTGRQLDRKRKLETENVDPNEKQKVSSTADQPVIGETANKVAKSGNEKSARNLLYTNNISKNTSNQLLSGAANANLSIRKLLENTRTETVVRCTDQSKEDLSKRNGYVDFTKKVDEVGKKPNDLSVKPRPSLPISIPLDCLPSDNIKNNHQSIQQGQSTVNLCAAQSDNAQTGTRNTDLILKVNEPLSSDQPGQKHVSSSVLNHLKMPDKMIIPKKRSQVYNGNTTGADQVSLIVNTNKPTKRKFQTEADSVSKRLLLKSDLTGSEGMATSLLMTTDGQPLVLRTVRPSDANLIQQQPVELEESTSK